MSPRACCRPSLIALPCHRLPRVDHRGHVVAGAESLEHVPCRVSRAVVDDNDFAREGNGTSQRRMMTAAMVASSL